MGGAKGLLAVDCFGDNASVAVGGFGRECRLGIEID